MARTYRSTGGQKSYTEPDGAALRASREDYTHAAAAYRALAAEHRSMAKDAAK